MSEGELIQATQATWGNVISLIGITITILSGYLIVAYVAGRDMSRSQVVIVNTRYVLIFSLMLMSVYTLTLRATEMGQLSIEASAQRSLGPRPEIPFLLLAVFSFCLLASLKFMWDVRQKGKQHEAHAERRTDLRSAGRGLTRQHMSRGASSTNRTPPSPRPNLCCWRSKTTAPKD